MTTMPTTDQPETETRTRTFEIPVILNVTVETCDGLARIVGTSHTDSEAAPWAFSGEPAAYEPDTDDGGTWHEGRDEDDPAPEAAWDAAYEQTPPVDPLHFAALARIVAALDVESWSPDTLDEIAEAIEMAGLKPVAGWGEER